MFAKDTCLCWKITTGIRQIMNLGYFAGGKQVWQPGRRFQVVLGSSEKPRLSDPMMQDIKSIRLRSCCNPNSGPGGCGPPDVWLRQIAAQRCSLAMGAALLWARNPALLSIRQIKGLLIGLRSAAEYELLIEKPGIAVAQMDAQSAAHAVILILIILGNLGYFYGKRSTRGESD